VLNTNGRKDRDSSPLVSNFTFGEGGVPVAEKKNPNEKVHDKGGERRHIMEVSQQEKGPVLTAVRVAGGKKKNGLKESRILILRM